MTSIVSTVNVTGTTIRIPGNFVVQSALASVTATDPNVGQTVSCTGMGSSNFMIFSNQVVLTAPLDFLRFPSLTFKVACADNGLPSLSTTFTTFTFVVVEVEVGGEQITLLQSPSPIPENSAQGTSVGIVSAIDPNGDATTLTFSTASSDHFEFSGTPVCVPFGTTGAKQCQATLVVRGGLDFVAYPTDVVHVTTVDNRNIATTASVNVVVSNSPSAPSGVSLTVNRVTQGAANGFVIGNVVVVARVQPTTPTYTVTLTDDAGGRIALVRTSSRRDAFASQYAVTVADSARINHIATPQLSIQLTVTDGTFTKTFTTSITVDARVIVPVMPARSISQDSPVGFKIATVSLQYFQDYRVGFLVPQFTVAGTNKALFAINADSSSGSTASLSLIQSISTFASPTVSFDIIVTFVGDVVAPVQATFTLTVTAVNQPPVFTPIDTVYVRKDTVASSLLVTVTATDPAGSPITYALVSSFANFLSIDANSGDITSNSVPSDNSAMALGAYTAVVSASNGISTTTSRIAFDFIDYCYVLPGDITPCADASTGELHGTCVDTTGTYYCNCDFPFEGDNCQNTQLLGGGNSVLGSSNAIGAGSIVGIVIGVVAGLVIVLFVVLIVLRRRKDAARKPLTDVDAEGQAEVFNNGFIKEVTYDTPNHAAPENDFEPGVNNPMYAWYQPQMSRQECEEYLSTRGEGAFVIRDSSFTPGWHMLGVKTGNAIVHERIKLNQDGTYELLPSTGAHQPGFKLIPQLVDHYAAVKRQGVGFSLATDNPIYDNHLLQAAPRAADNTNNFSDPDAPALPSHYARTLSSAGTDSMDA